VPAPEVEVLCGVQPRCAVVAVPAESADADELLLAAMDAGRTTSWSQCLRTRSTRTAPGVPHSPSPCLRISPLELLVLGLVPRISVHPPSYCTGLSSRWKARGSAVAYFDC